MNNKYLLSEAHHLLRTWADVSVLDELDDLTHHERIALIQKYIRFEQVFIGDVARRAVANNIAIAKQSNKRVKEAQTYLTKLLNLSDETLPN